MKSIVQNSLKKTFILLSFFFLLNANAQYVSTIAGSIAGFTDGTVIPPSFRNLSRMAIDASGNIFVADSDNNLIRKITPTGVVTTFAGSGTAGFADGAGTAAQFNIPTGVAVDASGNVFVADPGNNRIRKITAAGVVSTFAGSGVGGYADGSGTSAQFADPFGVAIDAAGNVFVADAANHRIRKITTAGVVSTFAGSGIAGYLDYIGTVAQFRFPSDVAVDAAGNVFVADAENSRIRKITAAGLVTTFAGSGTAGFANGTGTIAQFNNPLGLAVDAAGNVFVTDSANNRIRKITSAGVVTTFAGSGTNGVADGIGTAAQFARLIGVALDAAGNVYVTDINCIRKITAAGVVSTWVGMPYIFGDADGVGTPPKFYAPDGVAIDAAGNLFVADSGNNRIRKITVAGLVTTFAGSSTAGFADGAGTVAQFNIPHGVAVDAVGNVFIADTGNHRIRKITSAGVVTTFAGFGTAGNNDGTGITARFNFPWGLAIDDVGNVFVGDLGNNRIRKITSAGVVTTFAGSLTGGYGDGLGTAARFAFPSGVTVDATGNVFVADSGNNRIRKITSAGLVTTFAGSGTAGFANGTGTIARFNNPYGLTVDASGNVFVADSGNNRIRKITAAGVVTLLAGSNQGYADGVEAAAQFNNPGGVAVDATGNVFVADNGNNRIRKIEGALGIAEFSNTSLQLYPNPTHSLINIQTSNSVLLDKITITDLTGKKVMEQTQNTNQVSVEKLARGVYILNGYSEGSKFQEKFIKE